MELITELIVPIVAFLGLMILSIFDPFVLAMNSAKEPAPNLFKLRVPYDFSLFKGKLKLYLSLSVVLKCVFMVLAGMAVGQGIAATYQSGQVVIGILAIIAVAVAIVDVVFYLLALVLILVENTEEIFFQPSGEVLEVWVNDVPRALLVFVQVIDLILTGFLLFLIPRLLIR